MQGRYKEALEYYQIAYDLLKKIRGESHSDTQYVKDSIDDVKKKMKEQ